MEEQNHFGADRRGIVFGRVKEGDVGLVFDVEVGDTGECIVHAVH